MRISIRVFTDMEKSNPRIAILSGKGGTGKTLVSVNLSAVSDGAVYVDCDVEEPNGHIFLKPEWTEKKTVATKLPLVDKGLCTGCRKCIDFCRFNALAYIAKRVVVFENICHSCGGCSLVCPENAISEYDNPIGEIKSGWSDKTRVYSGITDIGVESGVPVIRQLLEEVRDESGTVILDCPPGSSCSVMESIKDADYCLLVAEPSLFGAHNLRMVHQLVHSLGKPFGAVLNKCGEGEDPSERYCQENNIRIIGRIPFDMELGRLNSNGMIATRENERFEEMFKEIFNSLMSEVKCETASDS